MTTVKHQPIPQQELPLSAIAPHKLFPGRTSLYVSEVAKALQMTERQVLDLIDEGALEAVNIASPGKSTTTPTGNITPRKFWRVPVSAYDAFIQARKASARI